MVKISARYIGEKHCTAKHEPSHALLETDAPKDNLGRGESFSPTDLVATALGTCILTTMAIVAERDGVDLKGATMYVEKVMNSNPRTIASLKTIIEMPASLPQDYRHKMELVAHSCPVKKSLHPDVQVPIEFKYSI
jgi:putative redox protein